MTVATIQLQSGNDYVYFRVFAEDLTKCVNTARILAQRFLPGEWDWTVKEVTR